MAEMPVALHAGRRLTKMTVDLVRLRCGGAGDTNSSILLVVGSRRYQHQSDLDRLLGVRQKPEPAGGQLAVPVKEGNSQAVT